MDANTPLSEEHLPRRRPSLPWKSLIGLLLAALISISIWIISQRIDARQFARYGYPTVFVVSLLGNATIILPAPSLAIVIASGPVLNPFWVGLIAGVGEALGELTGYLAGYSGRAMVENRQRYDQIVAWMHKYGLWVIFVLSIIPNPLFDLAGGNAGALKVHPLRFLLVCWAGKTIKTTLMALGGRFFLGGLMTGA